MPDPDFAQWILPTSTLGGVAASYFFFSWWLSSQFLGLRKEFTDSLSDLGDRILNKMEYHERHDDARFSEIKNDIFAIKLRNAALDGRKALAPKKENDITDTL